MAAWTVSIAAALTAVLAAPGAAQTAAQPTVAAAGAPTATATSSPVSTTFRTGPSNEVLGPGDVVRLKIWREPDLSGDFNVDEHGMAVFPKIGPVHVSELTPDSLRKMLVATYSAYLRDPAIEVTMLRRVTVLGAVKNPGLYPIDPTMTVADVLALAGGAMPNGKQDQLELMRGGQKVPVNFTSRTTVGDTPIRSGDELYLPERSWLSRNGYVVGALVGAIVVVSTAIITHR